MLQYIKPIVRTELSCTIYLNNTYVFGNKDSPGSLDSNEVPILLLFV